MIYAKVHDTENGKMIAMCDESLIDKTLEEGKLVIDIKGYADFYRGELVSADEFDQMPEKGKIMSANIIGEESVGLAVGSGLIQEGHIKMINGIPYAHAYRV